MKLSTRRIISIFLLVVLATASFAGQPLTVQAADAVTVRYLSPTGSDTTNCTQASQPCQTVQYAIDQAAAGDALYLAAGAYSGVQTRNDILQVAYVDKNLSLSGGYSADFSSRSPETDPSILDAGLAGRVVYLPANISLTLDGVQLKNGSLNKYGNGIYAGAGGNQLTLTNTVISGCRSIYYGDGNGIYLSGGILEMSGSRVENNVPASAISDESRYGGGLYAKDATVHISTSTFKDNVAQTSGDTYGGRGAGIFLYTVDAVIDQVQFIGNHSSEIAWGYGGGLYAYAGTLSLTRSTFDSNTGSFVGGAVYILMQSNALIEDNTFIHNSASNNGGAIQIDAGAGSIVRGNHFEGNESGDKGGALALYGYFPIQITGNTFTGNQAVMGGAFYNDSIRAITNASSQVVFTGNQFQGNQATTDGGAVYMSSSIDFINNQFLDNQAGRDGGAIYHAEEPRTEGYHLYIDGNLLRGNTAARNGGAMAVFVPSCCGLVQEYRSNAFLDNQAEGLGGAVYFSAYTDDDMQKFVHTTFSGNTASDGSTFYLDNGKANFANTIFDRAAVGIYFSDQQLYLDHVLFDPNTVTTPIQPAYTFLTPKQDDRVEGSAGLDVDGYHLTAASDAIDAGIDLGVTYDIDQQPRLAGTAPDLGADESPFSKADGVQAQLLTSTPLWKMNYTDPDRPPLTTFEQTYLVSYGNYEDSLQVTQYAIQDQFPADLEAVSSTSQPEMTYSASGSSLSWASQSPLAPGALGWVGVTGRSDTLLSGAELSNNGQFTYTLSDGNTGSRNLSSTVTVPARPVFPPLIITPWTGEICLDDSGQLTATGLASNNVTVNLYEDGVLVGSAEPDEKGKFTITWPSALSPSHDIELAARSCETPDNCSVPSEIIDLEESYGGWCPQRSYWEGSVNGVHYVFRFRNGDGKASTRSFVIPGLYGFWNTQLHLFSCCDTDTNPFTVIADDIEYTQPSSGGGREWTFNIGSAHEVEIRASCGGDIPTKVTQGEVLIDPDGFVFNQAAGGSYDSVTGMFAPVQPLSGFTVTAYVWVEAWGAWIQWPAELYDNQVNPQITPASGYYAFFTPPGKYYLETTGKDGYQTWRSPVVEVVSELVHMNTPLTAWNESAASVTVISTPSGLSQPQVTIPVGGSVTWQSSIDASTTAIEWSALQTNPLARLLSTLDPLADLAAWDSGMLLPGGAYSRKFTQPGTYTYTDGFGHTGTVTVSEQGQYWVRLPLIQAGR